MLFLGDVPILLIALFTISLCNFNNNVLTSENAATFVVELSMYLLMYYLLV